MTHEHPDRSFDQALEAALHGRKAGSEPLSQEDQAVLAMASDLAGTDFSAEYGARAALRRRLLDRHGEARGEWSLTGGRNAMLANKRRLALTAAALVLAAGLAFARFSPAMAGSRERVAGVVAQSGMPYSVQQVVFDVIGAHFGAAYINGDGDLVQVTFNNVSSVEEARAAASFPVKQPTALPEGYSLKSAAVSADGRWVNLHYENSAGDPIMLSENTLEPPPGAVGAGPDESGLSIQRFEGSPEDGGQSLVTSEGGPTAGAVPLNVVRWEEDGVYFELSGTLSEAELQAIADSVQ